MTCAGLGNHQYPVGGTPCRAELGRQLEKLAGGISTHRNPTTGSCRSYKGNYTETVTAAIFAFSLAPSQPAIVQVNENRDCDHDGGEGRDLSRVRIDAG